jgi:hypothetical protein
MFNISLCRSYGVDGVFLINQGSHSSDVLAWAKELQGTFPDWFVGVNILGFSPIKVLELLPTLKGIWSDDLDPTFLGARDDWSGLYFAGAAFKTQPKVQDYDLERAARRATKYCDVVTTSGPGTGKAATVDKIAAMKRALGVRSLALASGVTPDNVKMFVTHVDYILLATGISSDFYRLDPIKLSFLMENAHD